MCIRDSTRGKYVELIVVLEGMESIHGLAKDFTTGEYIEGVSVGIFGLNTLTNEKGEFVLEIPKERQSKFITLRASKAGYQNWEQKDIPTTSEKEIIIPLKKK